MKYLLTLHFTAPLLWRGAGGEVRTNAVFIELGGDSVFLL